MTAATMIKRDLRRWNLVQMVFATRLGVAEDPDRFFALGEWFAGQVDELGRLPRFAGARQALGTTETA